MSIFLTVDNEKSERCLFAVSFCSSAKCHKAAHEHNSSSRNRLVCVLFRPPLAILPGRQWQRCTYRYPCVTAFSAGFYLAARKYTALRNTTWTWRHVPGVSERNSSPADVWPAFDLPDAYPTRAPCCPDWRMRHYKGVLLITFFWPSPSPIGDVFIKCNYGITVWRHDQSTFQSICSSFLTARLVFRQSDHRQLGQRNILLESRRNNSIHIRSSSSNSNHNNNNNNNDNTNATKWTCM